MFFITDPRNKKKTHFDQTRKLEDLNIQQQIPGEN